MLLGLTHDSSSDQIASLVTNLITELVIAVHCKTPREFRRIAASFGHSFNRASITPLDIRDLEKLHMAFLVGISFS